MTCDCVSRLALKLKEQNLKFADSNYSYSFPEFERRFVVRLQWIDKTKVPKGKRTPPPLMTSCCPHCGKPATKA
jgi:hypothetical protein